MSSEFGIQHVYSEFGEGAGVSLVDFNGDGRDDITLATGSGQLLGLYLAHEGGFELIYPSGLSDLDGAVRSINWIDYDNDGDKDLFVTILSQLPDYSFVGSLKLYRQDGNLIFTDVTTTSGILAENPHSYGSVWADFDNDGFLDLYVCGYEDIEDGDANYLFHNLGDGTFEEIAEELGMSDVQGRSFTSVFFDADQDGNLDLFTANDREDSFNTFYRGVGDGTFEDQSVQSGLYTEFDAMGVDVGDYDNDGDLDIYVTNTFSLSYDPYLGGILFQNSGDATFTPLTNFPVGTDFGVFWGCSFVDFDYDRDLDLFAVNHGATGDLHSRKLFVNDGLGTYVDYSGIEFNGGGQLLSGLAQGDLNNDGFLDLVTLNLLIDKSEIWIGPPTSNNHVAVRLEGTISNRDGIGSIIEVWVDGEKRIDQTSSANSFASQDSDNYRFGIGEATIVDSIRIRWPSGLINIIENVPANAHLDILESDEIILNCIPTADIVLEPIAGLEQSFSLVDLVNVDSLAVHWTVNDSFVGTGLLIDYTFDTLGIYTICANISSSCATYSLCEEHTVSCITAVPNIIWNSPADLVIVASLDQSYDSVHWVINDEVIVQSALELSFSEPGFYELCAFVWDSCGMDSACVIIEVECMTPSADFTWTHDLLEIQIADFTVGDTVLWTLNGEPLTLSEGATFELPFSGEFELCAEVVDSCGVVVYCDTVFVELLNGFEEYSASEGLIDVWPNPVQEVLYVKSKEPILLFAMLDLSGRRIQTEYSKIRHQEFNFDVAHLKPGAYNLIFEGKSGRRYPIFFIKT